MSREESEETSHAVSGSDSEGEEQEEQTIEDESSRSESSSGSESESDTEGRFMMLKNDVGDKRDRDEPPEILPSSKRIKVAGGKAAPISAPEVKAGKNSKAIVKKPVEVVKQSEPEKRRRREDVKEPAPKKAGWTIDQEHALVQHIFEEMKSGLKPPKRGSRGENYHYWGDVQEAFQGKFPTDWTKEQLYDKYRRMKGRFDVMVEKERAEGVSALKFKSPGEEKVYNVWKEMFELQEQEDQEVDTRNPKSLSEEEAGKKEIASSSKQNSRKEVKQNGGEERNPGFAAGIEELQRKYNAELAEMKGKFEEVMNNLQVRSSSLAFQQEGCSSGGLNGLNEWLMLSMAARSSPLFNMEMMTPHMFGIGASGGLFGGVVDPAAMKLREHWLKQQEEELRVMEQRLQLLQNLCHHQQELLRKQQQQ